LKCWGAGSRGQLGNGAAADSATPVLVQGLGAGVRAISVGLEHTCAVIDRDGSVQCWGRNDFGQLGNGTTTDATAPKPVQGIGSQVAMLASGGYHNCVVTNAGGARCWGLGLAGQLGNGDASAQASAPVAVQGLDRQVTSIALGLYHSCATTGAGALVCWGENGSGALGVDESTEKSAVPISVSP
jgi:alpha-tubulin suppressor-like RCC1 family protein